jgi:PERQ amino acid-rich with GYF domain-containing protein
MMAAESLVDNLLAIGLIEPDIITEGVHGQTHTINSQHFGEEFVRRYKLAQAGVPSVPSLPANLASSGVVSGTVNNGAGVVAGGGSGAGGWSEVAKRTPATQAQNDSLASFKVVTGKKKSKK